jgi:hypothetical protein
MILSAQGRHRGGSRAGDIKAFPEPEKIGNSTGCDWGFIEERTGDSMCLNGQEAE